MNESTPFIESNGEPNQSNNTIPSTNPFTMSQSESQPQKSKSESESKQPTKRTALSIPAQKLNQWLPHVLQSKELPKNYPIPHSQTKKELGVTFHKKYKSIKMIRPGDHITALCRYEDCIKGEQYNNNFKNRRRLESFKKNHHNKLHGKDKPIKIIIASHFISKGPNYIGYEYQLCESHEPFGENQWGPLNYLNFSLEFYGGRSYGNIAHLIDEMYGINSNKYRIGEVMIQWLCNAQQLNALNNLVSTSNNLNEHVDEDIDLKNDEEENITPINNEEENITQINHEETSQHTGDMDINGIGDVYNLPDIDINGIGDVYNIHDDQFNHLQQDFDRLKEVHEITVKQNISLMDQNQFHINESKRYQRELNELKCKNDRYKRQLNEVKLLSGIKP
eukprot:211939_1